VRLRFTSHATRQLDSIAQYIGVESPATARRVGDRIRKAARFLSRLPNLGRTGAQTGTRELIVSGLPYVVVYRLVADTVKFLGVYHTAQVRPGQSALADDA
jgi:toxin ParE1/3/4